MKSLLFVITILFVSLCYPVYSQTQKANIAVLTLKNTAGVTVDEIEILSDRLRGELFKTGLVNVMEREQMTAILKEQGFQQSGATCTTEGCMVEMGQLLGVQKLVSGSLGKLGSLFMINLRMIDIKTGNIVKVVSEDVKGTIENVVSKIPNLAEQLVEVQANSGIDGNEPIEDSIIPCTSKALIEKNLFGKATIGFDLKSRELNNMYQLVADTLSVFFTKGVSFATKKQIANLSNCQVPVIRLVMHSYAARNAKLFQKEGVIRMTFLIFKAPQDSEPVFKTTVEATGERNWGDLQPFVFAIQAATTEALILMNKSDLKRTGQIK